MKNNNLLQFAMICVVLFTIILALAKNPSPVYAAPLPQSAWCGSGSAPNYGFTYPLSQPHWTLGNGLVSEDAMTQVDVILDKLNADNIAQTMILVIPTDQVGIATNCAVHFLRYMQLGQPTGAHKDNGFAFVIVVGTDKIDVHYAVGLGLPALTAQGLTPINRLGEATFAETKSVDQALLDVITEFDNYARSKYTSDPSIPEPITQEASAQSVCYNLLCLVMILIFLIWAAKNGLLTSYGSTSRSSSSSRSNYGSISGGRSNTTPSRGGSGSGRSGRTN